MLFLACATLVALVAGVSGYGLAVRPTRYENLGNPTEYVFHVSATRMRETLNTTYREMDTSPLSGGFHADGKFGFDVGAQYYTKRYWTGYREKAGEVDPPEAGRIGTLFADFVVRIVPEGENCRLVVEVVQFDQQIGRTYAIWPHFRKTAQRKAVKSDTYFEYLFLTKVGMIVGEKGMPPLKGEAMDDEWPGKR